jgi:hypothetical protein
LRGRKIDHLHTLKGERRKRRGTQLMCQKQEQTDILPSSPEMLKNSPMLSSIYNYIKKPLRKTPSKYRL